MVLMCSTCIVIFQMLSVVNSTRATWQDLGFTDLQVPICQSSLTCIIGQKLLESTVIELAANREKGESARAALVQLTREFRKSASEEIKKAVLTLLKSFQTEVDSSRKRCSFAEESYINVYKKLIDLPDPTVALMEVQTLQKKVNKTADLECENRKLRESTEHMKAELAGLKYHESEHNRLQKMVDELNQNMNSNLKEKSARLEENYSKLLIEKDQEMAVLKTEMEEKFRVMEEKCLNLTKGALDLAQSELFNLKTHVDKSEMGKSSELEILVDELAKANEKIKELETNLSLCKDHMPSTLGLSEQLLSLQSRVEDLEADLRHKESEISSYVLKLSVLQSEKQALQDSMQSNIDELRRSLANCEGQLMDTQRQLEGQSDYSEISRELAFLRSIEFPDERQPDRVDLDTGVDYGTGREFCSTVATNPNLKQPLEVLLMNKNRALQNQLAELNVAADRLKSELERLQMFETEAKQREQEQSELITLLESDLYRLQSAYEESQRVKSFTRNGSAVSLSLQPVHQSGGSEGQMLAEAIGENTETVPDITLTLRKSAKRVQPLTKQAILAKYKRIHLEWSQKYFVLSINLLCLFSAAPAPLIDPSLLQIVENQRDRYRARTDELEQTETNLRHQLVLLQREVESIRVDNVKLYEKIRFLQSYSSPVCASGHSIGRHGSVSSPGTSEAPSDPFVQKYFQVYEANLDPFNQFSKQERQRHYQELRPHEKIMLKTVRLVVGNRTARLGAFIYAIVLHVLVFLALYKAAHFQTSAIEAEATCLER
ncbi:homeobox protein cut-like [Paragonimus westermani]|uniref:Protein CASP n=1 Tax=Paragonimus westermani TaxID=34504 RepID=A0A5J4NP96_9TREM|nr:homeobox protein cut-like [Paragonimus westermani]